MTISIYNLATEKLSECKAVYWLTMTIIAFGIVTGCTPSGTTETLVSQADVDVDATVQVSIAQTTTSNRSVEATVAAAVRSTQLADDELETAVSSAIQSTAESGRELLSDISTVIPASIPTVQATAIPTVEVLPTSIPPSPTVLVIPTAAPTATPVPVVPTQVPSPTPTLTPTQTPVPRELTLAELIVEVGDSVVQVITNRGLGSGVIIDVDDSGNALVLTNHHVVELASSLEVVYLQSQSFNATVVGDDPIRDLAVIKICCDNDFAALEFSSAGDIALGAPVVALGFPLGVDSLRVSQGIVSGKQYSSTQDRFELQTDAAINPGNSGGPLLLMNGTIAGINTYGIRTSSSGVTVEGFGFAVSAETLESAVPSLSAGNSVAVPTPTPNPLVVNGNYSDSYYGFVITPPDGWIVESREAGMIMWDELVGSTLLVSVSYQGSEYFDTSEFRADWILTAGTDWEDFVIEKEQTIYRSSNGGSQSVEGHEFDTRFTIDQVPYEAFTHWFIVSGWLYQLDLITPAEVWQLPSYADLRQELQFASISFHPPGS